MTTDGAEDDGFLAKLSDPAYDVTEGVATPGHMHGQSHGQSHGNVRRFEHAGHQIEIETHYRITIDGQEFPDQLHVADDGTVHYHGYPQYRSPSAVDIVKRIAEDFLAETPPPIDADGDADTPGQGS